MMKRLGDYIRPVDVRNRDLKVERLLGISVTKEFIPSIANTIGTDMSVYKVVYPRQFVYISDTSRRGDKIAIAYLKENEEPALVSAIYTVFEIVDTNALDPEYLMMWFRRPEFDRYARFHSHGSAREVFDWDEMCEVQVPVPDIKEQRNIVAEYKTLQTRIDTNKKLIATLEQTAQTLYRHTFVDNIDPNNLPEGWRMGTIGDFGEVVTGKTPSSECPEDFGNDLPFVTPGDFQLYHKLAIGAERGLSTPGAQKLKTKIIPQESILVTCIGSDMGKVAITTEKCITNQQINAIKPKHPYYAQFIYYFLKNMSAQLKSMALGGSTMPMLSKTSFELVPALLPHDDFLAKFYEMISPMDKSVICRYKENQTLTQMQTLLLSKMGV